MMSFLTRVLMLSHGVCVHVLYLLHCRDALVCDHTVSTFNYLTVLCVESHPTFLTL